jgi:hypothetical protein
MSATADPLEAHDHVVGDLRSTVAPRWCIHTPVEPADRDDVVTDRQVALHLLEPLLALALRPDHREVDERRR